MAKLATIAMACAAYLAPSGMTFAQSAAPITNRDVVGQWALVVTPVEQQGRSITFKSSDGRQQLDFPLTITAQPNGRLTCVADGNPADCRIRDGDLVVVSSGGGVRMTFTLTDRTRAGLSGTASLRVRLLPIGGPIGSVVMTRR
ncbi:MAG TPA: hypothetical protein VF633_02500 [Brevundimonas sp.]|jgi:hypothetical protein